MGVLTSFSVGGVNAESIHYIYIPIHWPLCKIRYPMGLVVKMGQCIVMSIYQYIKCHVMVGALF